MEKKFRFGTGVAAAMVAVQCFAASGATYKVDVDRKEGVYRCGETATFTVCLLSTNNLAAGGASSATLDNFGTSTQKKMPFDVAATGVAFTVSGTLDKPGFLRLSLPPTRNGRDDPFVFSVGFEPEKIKKGSPSPADFDEFWAGAKVRLAREVPLDPQVVRVPERSTADFDFYRISFATFGRRVHGYMSVPTDKSKAPFPVDFGVNAAGFGGWTNDMKGEKDSVRVQFSVYPFPPDWKWKESGLESAYKAMDAECKAKYGASRYCQAGITESREAYFFYPVILGIDRAVDWVAARSDVDRSRFRYEGTSQGGGFGFYLCGLNRAFTRAVFYVPAITDTMGYLKGRDSGWPKIVENNSSTPERRAAAEKWAPYFDAANFASRITCPVRVAVGFSDTTCPPCAVYSAYNEIKVSDKAICNGIGMTHSCFGRFYTELGRWAKSPSVKSPTISFLGEFDREMTGAEYSGVSRVPGTDRYWLVDDSDGTVAEMKIEIGEGLSATGMVLRTLQLDGRKDPEGCAVDPLRNGVLWVSDEDDHSVRAFDMDSGREVGRAALPKAYQKCRKNRSLESLSISPDGLEMWVSNEEPMPGDKGFVRITRLSRTGADSPWKADEKSIRYRPDPVVGAKFMGRYAYSGVSDLVALGKGRLLVLERECSVKDDDGSMPSCRIRIYECAADGSKTMLWEKNTGLANYEGICLGPELEPGVRSLLLVSDGGNGADEKITVLRFRP